MGSRARQEFETTGSNELAPFHVAWNEKFGNRAVGSDTCRSIDAREEDESIPPE